MAKRAAPATVASTAYIYGLRDKSSDRYFYIGSTRKILRARLTEHLGNMRRGTHTDYFSNAARKIGVENIVIDLLDTVTAADRFTREYEIIQIYRAEGHRLANVMHTSADERRYHKSSCTLALRSLTALDFWRMMNVLEFEQPHFGHPTHDRLQDGIRSMFKMHADDVRAVGLKTLGKNAEACSRLERLLEAAR